MPASDTVSNVSTATAASQTSLNAVLRQHEFQDGMVCRANHSVQHAIVTALRSILPTSSITPNSRLQRQINDLPGVVGRYRPLVIVEKPRGRIPAQIVLTTRFDKRPAQEVDAVAQTLAVPFGNATPPWPTEYSPRIRVVPEWTDANCYVLAFAFDLQPGRAPKRYHVGRVQYKVERAELDVLRDICADRADMLAAMTPEEAAALRASYEAHAARSRSNAGSVDASIVTGARSQLSMLPSILEDEPVTPIAEVDEEGFIRAMRKSRRRGSASSRRRGIR